MKINKGKKFIEVVLTDMKYFDRWYELLILAVK